MAKKRKAGQPTKYRASYGETLIQTFKDGHFIGTFCADVGIHKDTFNEWKNKYPEFSAAYKRARCAGDKHYTTMLRLLATGHPSMKGGNVTAAIYLTKCGLKWRDDEVEVDSVDEIEFYG